VSISPQLRRKLQEILGADAADVLVNRLELVDANRGDVGELRHEMQLGFARVDGKFQQVDARFQQVDARFQQLEASIAGTRQHMEALIAGGQSRMEALLEKGLREQTRFFFLAWSVLLAAIVGLYAR
jgi:hypothetical protein